MQHGHTNIMTLLCAILNENENHLLCHNCRSEYLAMAVQKTRPKCRINGFLGSIWRRKITLIGFCIRTYPEGHLHPEEREDCFPPVNLLFKQYIVFEPPWTFGFDFTALSSGALSIKIKQTESTHTSENQTQTFTNSAAHSIFILHSSEAGSPIGACPAPLEMPRL